MGIGTAAALMLDGLNIPQFDGTEIEKWSVRMLSYIRRRGWSDLLSEESIGETSQRGERKQNPQKKKLNLIKLTNGNWNAWTSCRAKLVTNTYK